jgi:hypothetical protein
MKYNKSIFSILLFGLFLSFYSCASLNVSAGSKKKPDWVKERPVSDRYYIGIGMANTYQDNYIKVAKNNALTDMVSEISVQISSNSVLRQFEDNAGFREQFESITKMSMKDELEGYEIVDSWEGDNQYWVYYRLSIEKYKRLKREKLEKAKELAKDFYEKARGAAQSTDIHNALNYYVKAFEAIRPHLDEDLSIFTLEGRIELGNAIYQNIQEIFSSIVIEPEQQEFHIKALSANNPPVRARVYYENNGMSQPVNNLSMIFSFPELQLDKTEKVTSNTSGLITCSIAEMAPKGKQQKIKASLNTDTYFGKQNSLLNKMFAKEGNVPYKYLILNVSDLNAYFEASENEFGQPSSSKPIAKLFKKELSEDFFSFVPDKKDADVLVKVESNTVKGKVMKKYNLHTAYINCNISITNAKTNEEIYSTGISNVKGMKTGSFSMAAQDAREKAQQKIQQKIIAEIRKMNF